MTFTHSLYPDNWSEIATSVKQQAQWRCQKCGLHCIPPGEKTSHLTRSKRRVSVHATGTSLGQKSSK